MEWFKNKIRAWLGIDQLFKQVGDVWWEIHDSSGLKAKSQNHENVVDFLIEVLSQPEKYTWKTVKGRPLITWQGGWLALDNGSYYHSIESRLKL